MHTLLCVKAEQILKAFNTGTCYFFTKTELLIKGTFWGMFWDTFPILEHFFFFIFTEKTCYWMDKGTDKIAPLMVCMPMTISTLMS